MPSLFLSLCFGRQSCFVGLISLPIKQKSYLHCESAPRFCAVLWVWNPDPDSIPTKHGSSSPAWRVFFSFAPPLCQCCLSCQPAAPPRAPRDQSGGLRIARHVCCTLLAAHWPATSRLHARRRAAPPFQQMRRHPNRVASGVSFRGRRLHERVCLLRSSLSAAGHVQHRRCHHD